MRQWGLAFWIWMDRERLPALPMGNGWLLAASATEYNVHIPQRQVSLTDLRDPGYRMPGIPGISGCLLESLSGNLQIKIQFIDIIRYPIFDIRCGL